MHNDVSCFSVLNALHATPRCAALNTEASRPRSRWVRVGKLGMKQVLKLLAQPPNVSLSSFGSSSVSWSYDGWRDRPLMTSSEDNSRCALRNSMKFGTAPNSLSLSVWSFGQRPLVIVACWEWLWVLKARVWRSGQRSKSISQRLGGCSEVPGEERLG